MRLEHLFVRISQTCLVSLPLLPPSFFRRVLQSSSVQNKFNKHLQDTWAVKGYADLVHSGVVFIGIITQERNKEFPHFNCFEKQAFCDLLWQLQNCTESSGKQIMLSHSEWALPFSFLHCFIAVKQLVEVTRMELRHRGSVIYLLEEGVR